MQIFPARDVEGMDNRAALTDDRFVVTELLFLTASSGGTTLKDTAADSVCVVLDAQITGIRCSRRGALPKPSHVPDRPRGRGTS